MDIWTLRQTDRNSPLLFYRTSSPSRKEEELEIERTNERAAFGKEEELKLERTKQRAAFEVIHFTREQQQQQQQ